MYHLCYTTTMAKGRRLFTDQDYLDVLGVLAKVEDGQQALIEVNEREHGIGNIKIPTYVLEFCSDHGILIKDFISCLLNAFVLEMETGLVGRERHFLKKLAESSLPTEVKNSVIKILIQESN